LSADWGSGAALLSYELRASGSLRFAKVLQARFASLETGLRPYVRSGIPATLKRSVRPVAASSGYDDRL